MDFFLQSNTSIKKQVILLIKKEQIQFTSEWMEMSIQWLPLLTLIHVYFFQTNGHYQHDGTWIKFYDDA